MGANRPVIGPASLLESDDRPAWWSPPGRPHRLEAVIGTLNDDGMLSLHHWFCGQQRPDTPWLRGDLITASALAPGAVEQRGRPGTAAHELVVHVAEPDGLIEYAWSVNEPAPSRWRRIGPLGAPAAIERPAWDGPEHATEWGSGTVIATATAATRLKSGWVQALVQVDGSVYHLHRRERAGPVRWVRHACLRLDDLSPWTAAPLPSRKVAQVTGERDSQPARPDATLSTRWRSGVLGTDLGVRVDHEGRTFLLFGDTHWHRRPWLGTRDAIAEVHDPDVDLPAVRLHGAPLSVRGGGVTLREYDVPLDAFSLDGELYAFFTSDHFRDAQVMGRSVLTRAPGLRVDPRARWRPLRFHHLGTFSTHRFINVSAQRIGAHLYLWGSGAYRADDLRLARVDLTTPGLAGDLRAGRFETFAGAVRYWTGHGRDWSACESEALPLLSPGALGEVSVRWVPEVDRYLMLTMSGPDDPIGAAVVLRAAAHPWGPWSPRLRLFDWVSSGMSFADPARRFIKAIADGSDPVGDRVFRAQSTATGAAYAPYFYDARLDGDELVLRYTLSTWNPYQVVLMQHRIARAWLAGVTPAPPVAQCP